jgi:hypothetical protein
VGSSLWERMRESAVFQTMSTLYYNSTDAETTHLTLREVCPEANIHYSG